MYDAPLLGERESWEEVVWWLYIRSCSGLTSFARARFIDVMRTNFFFKKYSPEASFCMQREKERREEERRGRKVYILTSPSYGCG